MQALGTFAMLNGARGIAISSSDNSIIFTEGNQILRMISSSGKI